MELKLIYVCLGKHLLIIFSVRPAQILLLERLIEHKNTLVTKHLSKKNHGKNKLIENLIMFQYGTESNMYTWSGLLFTCT